VAIWRATGTMLAISAIGMLPASAEGGKHHRHKPAGVKGVVLGSTCPGALHRAATPRSEHCRFR
jgi:hypothetical protein